MQIRTLNLWILRQRPSMTKFKVLLEILWQSLLEFYRELPRKFFSKFARNDSGLCYFEPFVKKQLNLSY